MRILYTLNSGNPGGMEQHVLDLVTGMVNEGNKVYVWCREGDIVNWFKNAGAEVTTENIGFDIDPYYIYKLASFLRSNKIDVIHAHELKAVTNSLLAGFISETKVRVSHTHTPISEWTIEKYKKAYDFFKVFGYSTLVKLFGTVEIALTESRKSVKMREGIPEHKLVVIPNAIDVTKFEVSDIDKKKFRDEILNKYKIPNSAFIFGIVGRMTQEKGHDTLVEAFSSFLKMNLVDKDYAYLLIAGGGVLENKIREKCVSLGISERVVISGVFSKEDKIKYLSAMDVFVFPSKTEGFGIVLTEAMVCGIPCICSDLPVLQEVGGSSCIYFETENSDNLAQKMKDIYLKRSNLDNLKISGRDRVLELYSMPKFIEAYTNLYNRLLENK